MLDVKNLQRNLKIRADGVDGPVTYGALFDHAAGRKLGAVGVDLAQAAVRHFTDYKMKSPLRLAHFIGTIAHETGRFNGFEEDLNYSVKAIRASWPARFPTDASAFPYARNPEALANKTYGLRMGNVDGAHDTDEHPDGWQYRGRGPGQLTGKANYFEIGNALGIDLVNHPDLAADPGIGLLIVLEFWKRRRLNDYADADDARGLRKKFNGGLIGLGHVIELTDKMKDVLL